MPRPGLGDKLSEAELANLSAKVRSGIEAYGTARKFAEALGLRPPLLSMALHGRLVARTEATRRISNFEIIAGDSESEDALGTQAHSSGAKDKENDDEIVKMIRLMAGGTKSGRAMVLKLLKAAAEIQKIK